MVSFSRLKELYPENWHSISQRYKRKKNYTCEECGRHYPSNSKWLHVHHIVPLSQGGNSEDDNLQLLCYSCHKAKHNHMGNKHSPNNHKARFSKPFN